LNCDYEDEMEMGKNYF